MLSRSVPSPKEQKNQEDAFYIAIEENEIFTDYQKKTEPDNNKNLLPTASMKKKTLTIQTRLENIFKYLVPASETTARAAMVSIFAILKEASEHKNLAKKFEEFWRYPLFSTLTATGWIAFANNTLNQKEGAIRYPALLAQMLLTTANTLAVGMAFFAKSEEYAKLAPARIFSVTILIEALLEFLKSASEFSEYYRLKDSRIMAESEKADKHWQQGTHLFLNAIGTLATDASIFCVMVKSIPQAAYVGIAVEAFKGIASLMRFAKTIKTDCQPSSTLNDSHQTDKNGYRILIEQENQEISTTMPSTTEHATDKSKSDDSLPNPYQLSP